MRHLKTFENYGAHENYPSESEMCKYLMGCGYTSAECNSMEYDDICREYDICRSAEVHESKKSTVKGRKPKTAKEKKFAALAPPRDRITFADKIAGATKKK